MMENDLFRLASGGVVRTVPNGIEIAPPAGPAVFVHEYDILGGSVDDLTVSINTRRQGVIALAMRDHDESRRLVEYLRPLSSSAHAVPVYPSMQPTYAAPSASSGGLSGLQVALILIAAILGLCVFLAIMSSIVASDDSPARPPSSFVVMLSEES